MFYLLNHRPGGSNKLMGAGVATVTLSDTYPPIPCIQRPNASQYWWDGATEPWYGDVGAVRWGNYIYAYGHCQSTPYVYLTRVLYQNATDLDCYEYWNGSDWQVERLYNMSDIEGVFWQINQGQVVWSSYFACFLFVYCGMFIPQSLQYLSGCSPRVWKLIGITVLFIDNWMNSKVLARTAPAPEGPWSDAMMLYQATPITPGSSIYAAAPQVQYDLTGKTLVITFTNHPNVIQAIRVVSSYRCLQ